MSLEGEPHGCSDRAVTRAVLGHYTDPLDAIWTAALARMGVALARSGGAYAHYDGAGTLYLAPAGELDPDDCLAQMILHEICHWLVQGTAARELVDWGLDNETSRDDELEHACLRLQAALLEPHGLRDVLAPTTDFRARYDALADDPFLERSESEAEAVVRARAAYARRNGRPFGPHLGEALERTAQIIAATAPIARSDSIYSRRRPAAPKHRAGLSVARYVTDTCGDCAWAAAGKTGALRCRQSGAKVLAEERACAHFERPFDCLGCGACCREAYDTVEVGPRDPAKKRHLALMVERRGGLDMARSGSRCIALEGGVALPLHAPPLGAPADYRPPAPLARPGGAPFTCRIYDERPQTCRDFTLGSEHCLDARRRVGLSL